MRKIRSLPGAVFGGLGFVLAGCGFTSEQAQGPALPDEPGIYAYLGKEEDYTRLEGSRDWEQETWPQRANLSPHVQFVIYHPALAADSRSIEEKVRLQKVAWVRSEIDGQGAIKPVSGSQWAVPPLDSLVVPVNLTPIEGRGDALYIVPTRPLDPGLYSLQLRSTAPPTLARVGVQWSMVDRAQYSAANCVDRYAGSASFYRQCGQQMQAMGELHAQGLKVHLVDPERKTVSGEPVLIIKGVVVNTTSDPRVIPVLQARIQDRNGATLQQWHFAPKTRELAPGQSIPFKTEMRRPPPETAQVNITFAPAVEAGLQQ